MQCSSKHYISYKLVNPQAISHTERYYQFDHYSLIHEDEVDKLDILRWWKLNELSYPVLSKMTRYILTITVSTVASKSVFSASNMVLDDEDLDLKKIFWKLSYA